MMISPRVFIDDHKNDTFEQLITEKDSLVLEIKKLEKIVFDPKKKNEEWDVYPGPDVRFQMDLEYLAELCSFLKEKYNKEVVLGKDEE